MYITKKKKMVLKSYFRIVFHWDFIVKVYEKDMVLFKVCTCDFKVWLSVFLLKYSKESNVLTMFKILQSYIWKCTRSSYLSTQKRERLFSISNWITETTATAIYHPPPWTTMIYPYRDFSVSTFYSSKIPTGHEYHSLLPLLHLRGTNYIITEQNIFQYVWREIILRTYSVHRTRIF